MKNTWVIGSAVLTCLVATGAGAQTQNGSNNPSAAQQGRITVTGCLQPAATAGSVGTSGTAGSPSTGVGATGTAGSTSATRPGAGANTSFILTNARVGGAPGGASGVNSPTPPGPTTQPGGGSGTTANSGISGAAGNGGSSGSSYVLRGQSDELARHVGQQVEVSGRVSAMATGAGAPPDSVSGRTTTGSATGGANGNTSGGNSGADADRNAGRVSPSRNDRPDFIGGSLQAIEVTTVRMVGTICAQP